MIEYAKEQHDTERPRAFRRQVDNVDVHDLDLNIKASSSVEFILGSFQHLVPVTVSASASQMNQSNPQ
jgi:hypothetical protein